MRATQRFAVLRPCSHQRRHPPRLPTPTSPSSRETSPPTPPSLRDMAAARLLKSEAEEKRVAGGHAAEAANSRQARTLANHSRRGCNPPLLRYTTSTASPHPAPNSQISRRRRGRPSRRRPDSHSDSHDMPPPPSHPASTIIAAPATAVVSTPLPTPPRTVASDDVRFLNATISHIASAEQPLLSAPHRGRGRGTAAALATLLPTALTDLSVEAVFIFGRQLHGDIAATTDTLVGHLRLAHGSSPQPVDWVAFEAAASPLATAAALTKYNSSGGKRDRHHRRDDDDGGSGGTSGGRSGGGNHSSRRHQDSPGR